ncbi:hypothetical protein F4808DRAFT_101051 [Astrocystis sublimbata]|nr:hypothetical protein F4808DRAFT_101051 [Astrocystis sublimbata]
MGFDPFMSNVPQGLQSAQYNPYAEEHNTLAGAGGSYYGSQNTFTAPPQPLQYHLYYPLTPIRDHLQPHQQAAYDFFLPESLRERLQKKSEATRQVLASRPGVQSLSIQNYHSLVPLDTKIKSLPGIFGLPTWVWKATSLKNGKVYCLRRVEGFRLTNEDAIKVVRTWKQVAHPSIVLTVEAFTTRDFHDSSLVFVHEYHPLSKTLAEHHFPIATSNRLSRPAPVSERVLWSYLVQLSSALKVIHKAKLAARCVDISKVILTEKNRIRLGACSISDVIQFEAHRPVEELQQEDLYNLGKLILSIGTNTPSRNIQDFRPLLEQLGRTYSEELKQRVGWLLWVQTQPKTAEQLVCDLAVHIDDQLASIYFAEDEITCKLGRELENGRLVRLLSKLGTINERPEYDSDPDWSETGNRYMLKLFRDYVFHQVDAQGNPLLDLGHILGCLNRLDAGTEEKIWLTSRDHQSTFLVTYQELKRQCQAAFGDLLKASTKQPQQTNRGF